MSSSGRGAIVRRLVSASGPILAGLAACAAVAFLDPPVYFWLVREDGIIEWGTFWAFVLAAGSFVRAWAVARPGDRSRWLALALALGCLFVAGEEMSWGQRLLGYRPPSAILAGNYQREVSLHNLIDPRVYRLAGMVLIGGLGIAVPLFPGSRRLPGVPPLALVPAFVATLGVYVGKPWSRAEEVAECALGVGLLLAAGSRSRDEAEGPGLAVSGGALALVLALGVVCDVGTNDGRSADLALRRRAVAELAALQRDADRAFESAIREGRGIPSVCGASVRLHDLALGTGATALTSGAFASSTRAVDADRATYLLDPWFRPYRLRHECSPDHRHQRVTLWSRGPNRKTDWMLGEGAGDDLVVSILEIEPDPRTPGGLRIRRGARSDGASTD